MKYFIPIIYVAILISCKSNDDVEPPVNNPIIDNGGLTVASNVLICNEGNFGWGNSTIAVYNENDKSIRDSAFYITNDYGLGDVCQSASLLNHLLYVIVNNSGKVEVINSLNLKSVGTIDGLNSPRYILPISNNKAYVTDLYANEISVVNLDDNSISKTIPCQGWTEEMVQKGEKVYITNIESKFLYVVNSKSDNLVDSIDVGLGVSSIQRDSSGSVWMLRANDSPALIRLNEDNSLSEFLLDVNANPSKLRYSNSANALYFIKGNVCEFSISSEIFNDIFIENNTRIFYGLGVNPNNGNVYISDAKDFIQNSTTYVYNTSGKEVTNFSSGVNSGFYLFN